MSESRNRQDLPRVLQHYMCILEGAMDKDELRVILADDARFMRDGKKWLEGSNEFD